LYQYQNKHRLWWRN